MNVNLFKKRKMWLLVFLVFIVGVTNSRADIQLTENLSMYGFVRQTLAISMGTNNPTLERYGQDTPDFRLIRSMFQVEFNYQPTDMFRVFMKGRVVYDQTYMWQSDQSRYDTTPWTYDHHGSDLMTGYGRDNIMASIPEIWVNFEGEDYWVRIGKQQIAWGDMPSVRIADKANPLDQSWHRTLEPEEFENIRIAEWAARVYYTIPERLTGIFDEVFIDAYVNPGDIHPDIHPAEGSPYMDGSSYAVPDPNFDLRGHTEWGARFGFNLGQLSTTLIYFSIHNDFGTDDETAPPPFTTYEPIDTYAATLSYSFPWPIGTTATLECSITPNQPWSKNIEPGWRMVVEDSAFFRGALYLEREVFFIPKWPASRVGFMYYRHHVRDGESVKLYAGPPISSATRLDWDMDLFYLSATQAFGPGRSYNHQITPSFQWCPEGAYEIKCAYNWKPDQYWRLDLGLMWRGGSSDRAFLPSGDGWMDEAYFRITYQF